MVRVPLVSLRLRVALVFLLGTIIVVYSIIPLPRTLFTLGPFGVLPIQSYLHFIAYATLGTSLAFVFLDAPYPNIYILLAVFSIAFVFGLFMELVQLQLPYRHFSYTDIGMNASGTALAVLLFRVVHSFTQMPEVN